MARALRSPFAVVAAVVALTLVTRIRDFISNQGDANVGAYLYVGNALLHGGVPYVDAWEYKPPGIFALSAAALWLFGDGARAASALGAIAVIVTALALYRIANASGGPADRGAAWIAALTSVMLAIENHGMPGDAEVYVNAFIALAFAATCVRSDRRAFALAGLAAAAALQMKLTAAVLIVAVVIALATRIRRAALLEYGLFGALLAAPFAVEAVLFARAGAFAAFADANWNATLRRAHGLKSPGDSGEWRDQWRILAPPLELGVFASLRPSRSCVIAGLWLAGAFGAVAIAGEYYARHFVLLVPAVALCGAVGLVRLAAFAPVRARTAILVLGTLATFFMHGYFEVKEGIADVVHRTVGGDPQWHVGDYTLDVSALRTATNGDPSFYAIQVSPEIYASLGISPPTRYVFAGNLLEQAMWPMLGFPGRDELARVLATRPHILAVGPLDGALDPAGVTLIEHTLASDYVELCRVRSVTIYQLRTVAARQPPHCDAPS